MPKRNICIFIKLEIYGKTNHYKPICTIIHVQLPRNLKDQAGLFIPDHGVYVCGGQDKEGNYDNNCYYNYQSIEQLALIIITDRHLLEV